MKNNNQLKIKTSYTRKWLLHLLTSAGGQLPATVLYSDIALDHFNNFWRDAILIWDGDNQWHPWWHGSSRLMTNAFGQLPVFSNTALNCLDDFLTSLCLDLRRWHWCQQWWVAVLIHPNLKFQTNGVRQLCVFHLYAALNHFNNFW